MGRSVIRGAETTKREGMENLEKLSSNQMFDFSRSSQKMPGHGNDAPVSLTGSLLPLIVLALIKVTILTATQFLGEKSLDRNLSIIFGHSSLKITGAPFCSPETRPADLSRQLSEQPAAGEPLLQNVQDVPQKQH